MVGFFSNQKMFIVLLSPWKHMLWLLSDILQQDASKEYPHHMFSWRNKKSVIWRLLLCGAMSGLCIINYSLFKMYLPYHWHSRFAALWFLSSQQNKTWWPVYQLSQTANSFVALDKVLKVFLLFPWILIFVGTNILLIPCHADPQFLKKYSWLPDVSETVVWVANIVDPDQILHHAASDLSTLSDQAFLSKYVVVVVQIFYPTRHQRHIEAAAIVMCMYLYSLAFMEHPCTLGAAVCHQASPCPL